MKDSLKNPNMTVDEAFQFQYEKFKELFQDEDESTQMLYFLNSSLNPLEVCGIQKNQLEEFKQEFEVDPTKYPPNKDRTIPYMKRKKGVKPKLFSQVLEGSQLPTK